MWVLAHMLLVSTAAAPCSAASSCVPPCLPASFPLLQALPLLTMAAWLPATWSAASTTPPPQPCLWPAAACPTPLACAAPQSAWTQPARPLWSACTWRPGGCRLGRHSSRMPRVSPLPHCVRLNQIHKLLYLSRPPPPGLHCTSILQPVHSCVHLPEYPQYDSHSHILQHAAGVHIQTTSASTSYVWTASMLSPSGRCRALDASADGYVRGETVISVVLTTADVAAASSATAQLAVVIRGSAVNQDGRSSSLTAPNGPAQQEVIRAATAGAGMAPAGVSGLSMHGTGRLRASPCRK